MAKPREVVLILGSDEEISKGVFLFSPICTRVTEHSVGV